MLAHFSQLLILNYIYYTNGSNTIDGFSIFYKDESKLLEASEDTDKTYIEEILPQKMKSF